LVTDTSNDPNKRGFFRERTSDERAKYNADVKAEGKGKLLIYENEHLRKACIVGHAKLSKYYAKTDHHLAYATVVFLTPFFNKKYFCQNMEFAQSEWENVERKIKELLEKKYLPKVYPPNPTPTLTSQTSSSSSIGGNDSYETSGPPLPTGSSLISAMFSYKDEPEPPRPQQSQQIKPVVVDEELTRYMNLFVHYRDFARDDNPEMFDFNKVLRWWKERSRIPSSSRYGPVAPGDSFPILARMARDYLAIS
ncbi:hypothetical protein HDU76_011674, partial [Blyttiomyces sp. JEL0837]